MNKPLDVAIIMDGNGRWAKSRGFLRYRGHQEGVKVFKNIINKAVKLDLSSLTVYAFSTENWKRPRKEVSFLMSLFKTTINQEKEELHENNIRVTIIGRRENLPSNLVKAINEIENLTSANNGLNLNIAFNYGGRAEICDMLKNYLKEHDKANEGFINTDKLMSNINEENLRKHLYNNEVPEIELLIRTGGEKRLSNYLLWQSAYAELYFMDKYWPDFTGEDLAKAIEDFYYRERKFGGLNKK